MYIGKKRFVLIITYLTAAVLALGIYTAVHAGMERGYRRTAEYGYAHAFEEVVFASAELSDALHRASYASGAELSSELCADIYASCLAAEMTMSALPFSTQELEHTAAFIGVAGDYARSQLRASAQTGFDDEARRVFASLYATAAGLTDALQELRGEVNSGSVLMDEPENVFAGQGDTVSAAMLGLEDEVGAAESGSYDGRYSLSAERCSKEPLPEAEARRTAAEFFGLDEEQLELSYTAESGVSCLDFDGGSICVDADGNVLSLCSGRSVAGDISSAELERKAREFLAARGFEDVFLVSSERIDSVQTMKFDCGENGVRCIGDSIRIAFAGDDGEIYAYDASGHVDRMGNSHTATAAVSEAEARAALPDGLSAAPAQLCYAETDGRRCVLCYGFACTGRDGEELFILVDAATGRQFDIISRAS